MTPATQLQLQKRLLLSGLGLRMPNGAVVGGNATQSLQNVLPPQLSAYPLAAAAAQVIFFVVINFEYIFNKKKSI